MLGPAGRRGGARRRRLAGHLLAQPAARPRAGRRGARRRPRGDGPTRSASSSPPSPALALALQLAAPAALAEDVTLGLLYVPLVAVAGVHDAAGPGRRRGRRRRSSPAASTAPDRRRPAAARAAPAGRARSTSLGLGAGRRVPRLLSSGRSRPPTRRRRSSRTARSCCRSRSPRPSRSSCTSAAPPDPVLPLRRAAADRRLGRAAGQPARRGRAGGGARRHPAVRPQHHDARRPAGRRARAAAAARRRAGGRGGRRVAVPHRRPAGGRRRRDGPGRGRLRRDDDLGRRLAGRRRCRPSSCWPRGSASGWPSRRSTPCCSPSPARTCTAARARWPSSPGRSGCSAGLSLLTAVALRRFTAEVDAIGTPFELCPDSPADCAAYDAATDAAILTQLHTVFAGAAIAAGPGGGRGPAPAARPEPAPDRVVANLTVPEGCPATADVETVRTDPDSGPRTSGAVPGVRQDGARGELSCPGWY